MELLCIGIKEEIDAVNDILNRKLHLFEREDLYIDTKTKVSGDTIFLSFNLNDQKSAKCNNIKLVFKHYIASAISDIVLELYQEKIIDRILNDKYRYFDKLERDKIKNQTLDYLKKNEYVSADGIMYRLSKKARILKSVIEYLDINNEINIEGFVNFRLKFFMDMIEEAIEKNIEDFIIEKEYKEFIKILQYFVDIQEPKIDLVNIFIKDNKYILLDKENKIIKNDFFEEIADELLESDMSYDDILISSLITIAPKKIIFHVKGNEDRKVIEVIDNIFINKMLICKGCEVCGEIILEQVNKEK